MANLQRRDVSFRMGATGSWCSLSTSCSGSTWGLDFFGKQTVQISCASHWPWLRIKFQPQRHCQARGIFQIPKHLYLVSVLQYFFFEIWTAADCETAATPKRSKTLKTTLEKRGQTLALHRGCFTCSNRTAAFFWPSYFFLRTTKAAKGIEKKGKRTAATCRSKANTLIFSATRRISTW